MHMVAEEIEDISDMLDRLAEPETVPLPPPGQTG